MTRANSIRIFAYTVEIFLCFLIKGSGVLLPQINNATPLLVLSIGITIALFESPQKAIIIGSICGALSDMSIGSLIGPCAIVMALLCFLMSVLFTEFLKINIIFGVIASGISVFASLSTIFLFNYAIKGYGNNLSTYLEIYIPVILYTWVSCIVFYFINKAISGNMKNSIGR